MVLYISPTLRVSPQVLGGCHSDDNLLGRDPEVAVVRDYHKYNTIVTKKLINTDN